MKYTETHEWIYIENDTITIGITEFATRELGDIVFVELPQPNQTVKQGEDMVVIESVKAASDILAPCDGTITDINDALNDNPGLMNTSPLEQGWVVKMRVADTARASLDSLMSEADYNTHIENA